MDFGAFVGIGYLLSEEELDALVANLTPEQYIKFRDNVWCYDVENGKHISSEKLFTDLMNVAKPKVLKLWQLYLHYRMMVVLV